MPITRRRHVPSDPAPEDELLDLPLSGAAVETGHEPPVLRPGTGDTGPPAPRRRRRRAGGLWLVLLLAFPLGALVGYFLSSDPPLAVLSADLLDFGELRLGTSGGDRVIRVSNLGEQALRVTGTALEGEAAGEFRVAADECAGLEIAARAECALRIAFSPTARGVRRARLRFDSNAPEGSQTVPLIGVGVAPELVLEPAELDFASQPLGSAGAAAHLRLGNRGTAPLELGRIRLGGGAGDDFRRLADGCSARRLEPGERCTLSFAFVPSREGERRASLRIESDDGTPTEVALVGRGLDVTPILRLGPERLDFGGVPVGAASPARRVTVANDGRGPLKVRGLRLAAVQDVAAGGAFELSAAACAGAELAPGGGCEVEVRFRPTIEARAATVLEIDTSSAGGPRSVPLTGTGTAPGVSVAPSRVSFGEVAAGAVSPARSLLLASSGSAALVIASVAVEGADAAAFAASGCAGGTIEPGSGCSVDVRFRPRRPGPHRAELVVRHNAASRPHRVPLNGLGVLARLSLDRQRIDFGEVAAGRRARQRLVLTNAGRADLEVRRLRLTGGSASGFDLDDAACSGSTLAPGESCAVEVVFFPLSAGAHSIRLAIDHSAAERTREVPVTATATSP